MQGKIEKPEAVEGAEKVTEETEVAEETEVEETEVTREEEEQNGSEDGTETASASEGEEEEEIGATSSVLGDFRNYIAAQKEREEMEKEAERKRKEEEEEKRKAEEALAKKLEEEKQAEEGRLKTEEKEKEFLENLIRRQNGNYIFYVNKTEEKPKIYTSFPSHCLVVTEDKLVQIESKKKLMQSIKVEEDDEYYVIAINLGYSLSPIGANTCELRILSELPY